MSVVDDYLASLIDPEKAIIGHMVNVIRQRVPDATEEISYNMPAFKHKGKAFIAIVANKAFMSIYPFGNLDRLGLDFSCYECTKGSIHFTAANPVPDDLLEKIIAASLRKTKT